MRVSRTVSVCTAEAQLDEAIACYTKVHLPACVVGPPATNALAIWLVSKLGGARHVG
jgi:hypothetical protein